MKAGQRFQKNKKRKNKTKPNYGGLTRLGSPLNVLAKSQGPLRVLFLEAVPLHPQAELWQALRRH